MSAWHIIGCSLKNKLTYCFNPKKNALLIDKRGISFEQVISVLEELGPIDVVKHLNIKKYPTTRDVCHRN